MHPPDLGYDTTDVKHEAAKTYALYLPFWGTLSDISGPKVIIFNPKDLSNPFPDSLSDVGPINDEQSSSATWRRDLGPLVP
jgi:hypothetical protein